MITEEKELLRYICGNNGFGNYYEIHMSSGDYYLRNFYWGSDYGRRAQDKGRIDRTLIVRLQVYYRLLDTQLHPTDAAFKKYWCEFA
jgi:hypothetical protein